MFRELIRKNKQLANEECIAILESETRGVLSVNGDNGYPYGMPMNHFYNKDDGCIYFHCGKTGHRLDSLKKDNKVSLCVCNKGERDDGDWAFNVKSVIVFGRIEIVDSMDEIVVVTTKLSLKFTSDMEYIKNEIDKYAFGTLLLKLVPEHICGKIIKES